MADLALHISMGIFCAIDAACRHTHTQRRNTFRGCGIRAPRYPDLRTELLYPAEGNLFWALPISCGKVHGGKSEKDFPLILGIQTLRQWEPHRCVKSRNALKTLSSTRYLSNPINSLGSMCWVCQLQCETCEANEKWSLWSLPGPWHFDFSMTILTIWSTSCHWSRGDIKSVLNQPDLFVAATMTRTKIMI